MAQRWHIVVRAGIVFAILIGSLAVASETDSASAVTAVVIGNQPAVSGTYLNAQDIADNLVFTNIAVTASTSITIADASDLSTSTFGTPHFNLTLSAPVINIGNNLNMSAQGHLNLTGSTLNLNGPITSGGTTIDPSRVTGTATQVNVLSNAASIQQGIDSSSSVSPVGVQVSPGQYAGNLTIAKPLTLSGDDGAAAAGAGPNAPIITGAQAGGDVIAVTSGNVGIDGLHLSGAVAGGSLASSVHGIFASGVDNLTVEHNTLDGFSGPAIDTPGSTNVVLNANDSGSTAPDTTPPAVTVTFPSPVSGSNGWFNAADVTPVVGTVTASDASTVTNISCTGAVVSGVTGYTTNTASGSVTVSGDGTHNVACTATDGATPANTGAAAGSTGTATIKIDTTGPVLNPTVSPNPVLLNGTATATANATDSVSGVATQSCAPVATAGPGPQTVPCTTTDTAGNTSTGTASYTVTYSFVGFLAPLNGDTSGTVLNVGNAGRTYPIKWQLTDANANYVTNAVTGTTIDVAKVTCSMLSGDPTDSIDYNTASGGTTLRYDSTANQYIFNWATPSTKNTCYRMTVTTPDNHKRISVFQLK